MTPPSIPLGIPARIVAGDSVVWDEEAIVDTQLGTFLPSAWSLTYELLGPDARRKHLTAAVVDGRWRATLTPEETAALKGPVPGDDVVQWTAAVSAGGARYSIRRGVLVLTADPATVTETSLTFALEMVRLWQEAVKAFARNQGISYYQLGARIVQRRSPAEMRQELAHWQREVRRLKRDVGGGATRSFGRRVQWRMTRTSS